MREYIFIVVVLLILALGAVGPAPHVAAQISRGQPFTCIVVNSAATALTPFVANGLAIGSCAAVPGQSMYITDVTASASAISTTTTDQALELKIGTGTACGTGTATIWAAYNLAFAAIASDFVTPLHVPQNVDLCWMDAVTGSKSFTVAGYYGP